MEHEHEYDTEFRVILPSGEPRWLGARGVVDFSVGPSPVMTTTTGAGEIPVAYLMRAGVPSVKDGIWLAHVPAAPP